MERRGGEWDRGNDRSGQNRTCVPVGIQARIWLGLLLVPQCPPSFPSLSVGGSMILLHFALLFGIPFSCERHNLRLEGGDMRCLWLVHSTKKLLFALHSQRCMHLPLCVLFKNTGHFGLYFIHLFFHNPFPHIVFNHNHILPLD